MLKTTLKTTTSNTSTIDTAAIDTVVRDVINKRICIVTNNTITDNTSLAASLPLIDIFLNPDRKEEKEDIITQKMSIATEYFRASNMTELYPKLFKILWKSYLPCFEEENLAEHMITDCEVAGQRVQCSKLFTRMPTDSGMCCTLNARESLRQSEYRTLVNEMQQTTASKKIKSKVGRQNGLKLKMDLHSNLVSFGTQDQDYNSFSLFLGQPAEFPVLKQRSLELQPGHEHFLDLSATVVSTTKEVRDIAPLDRNCYFGDESQLTFYQEYTFTNCKFECALLRLEKELLCIPWYLPQVSLQSVL